ncbi:MAG: rhomboid family intramembrane serine protease [Actinomycetota bacterium]|nr:rhomboid family intramembrane serine protease [Actinomycetota bacterium]
MSQPDLFVICKNCGAEVSPYVTECPYCGQRVRKRAPKLERGGEDAEPRAKRRRSRLTRVRADELEGIAPDTRPAVTLALIAASLLVTLLLAGGLSINDAGGIFVGADDDPWRYVTAPFVHDSLGYQFAALLAVGIFGSMIERRFGWFPVLLIFLAAGAAGAAAAVAADISPPLSDLPLNPVLGANGAALGLLCAWLVNDRRAKARGDDRENDLVGVQVFAAVLLLLPLAIEEASAIAGIVGAVTGALLGLALPAFRRR